VWHPIGAPMPAVFARRRIMSQAFACVSGRSVKTVAQCLGLVRNRKPLRSSAMQAASI
jgi:hypothetical protein